MNTKIKIKRGFYDQIGSNKFILLGGDGPEYVVDIRGENRYFIKPEKCEWGKVNVHSVEVHPSDITYMEAYPSE